MLRGSADPTEDPIHNGRQESRQSEAGRGREASKGRQADFTTDFPTILIQRSLGTTSLVDLELVLVDEFSGKSSIFGSKSRSLSMVELLSAGSSCSW